LHSQERRTLIVIIIERARGVRIEIGTRPRGADPAPQEQRHKRDLHGGALCNTLMNRFAFRRAVTD